MEKLVALLVLLIASPAMAGTASLTWVNATTNTDDTQIPATGSLALSSTRIEYFQCASATATWPASPTVVSVLAPATARVITGLTDGQLFCFRIASVNGAGTQSAYSAVRTKQVPITTPNPPVLTVVDTVAYRMRQSVDGFEMVALGTVAPGTVCGAKTVDGYNLVPRAAVTLANRFDTKPLLAFARCG